uniref:Uncharacterized protein n=1 Tax=Macrostomum lignano TaxID=282301 RepID=A0A1I8FEF3_9PLAT
MPQSGQSIQSSRQRQSKESQLGYCGTKKLIRRSLISRKPETCILSNAAKSFRLKT